MSTVYRDHAPATIRFTFLVAALQRNTVNERQKQELTQLFAGLRDVRKILAPGRNGGSTKYLEEYGWFLDWASKQHRFSTTDEALEATEKASTKQEKGRKLLISLLSAMAHKAREEWDYESRRECRGDD